MMISPCRMLLLLIWFSTEAAAAAAVSGQVCGIGEQGIWQPMGITMLGEDSLLFADSRHHSIKIINLTQSTLDTYAGSGLRGLQDGPPGQATFSLPYSVLWVPATDMVVVADYMNSCIRHITPGDRYTVTMWCGDPITSPTDLAVSGDGRDIYITDAMSHTILLFSTEDGLITTVAGMRNAAGYADGDSLSQARFHQPLGIALLEAAGGQQQLYIADWMNNAIRVLHISTRQVTTLLGGPGKRGFLDGPFATTALISGPKLVRVASTFSRKVSSEKVSSETQLLAISDSDNGAIRLLDLTTSTTSTLLGDGTRVTASQYNSKSLRGAAVWGLALDVGMVYFTEADSNRIRSITVSGYDVNRTINVSADTSTCPPPVIPSNETLPALPALMDSSSYHLSRLPPMPTPQEQCESNYSPSFTAVNRILHKQSYMFSTGDCAFLDPTGTRLVDTKIPPATTPTRTGIFLGSPAPHTNTLQGALLPANMSGMTSPAREVQQLRVMLKTPNVYRDTCRIQVLCDLYPRPLSNINLTMHLDISGTGNPHFSCQFSTAAAAVAYCTVTGDQCRALVPQWPSFAESPVVTSKVVVAVAGTSINATVSTPIAFHGPPLALDGYAPPSAAGIPPGAEGIWVDVRPRSDLIPGLDLLELDVYAATTPGQDVGAWSISLRYDGSRLIYVQPLQREVSQSLDHQSFDHQSFDHQSFDHQSLDHQSLDHQSLDHQSTQLILSGTGSKIQGRLTTVQFQVIAEAVHPSALELALVHDIKVGLTCVAAYHVCVCDMCVCDRQCTSSMQGMDLSLSPMHPPCLCTTAQAGRQRGRRLQC